MVMNSNVVDVNPGSGRALYQATDMSMPDFHDFGNAITTGITAPGVVSFRVEWAPSSDRHHYDDGANQWIGDFLTTSITCNWSGRTSNSTFTTDSDNATIFAEVGHQRSGVFYS
jgi:hypothetical protein